VVLPRPFVVGTGRSSPTNFALIQIGVIGIKSIRARFSLTGSLNRADVFYVAPRGCPSFVRDFSRKALTREERSAPLFL